ncbi:hypothetical protein MTO98_31940 [Mucilaginibacter sp. SMC90]|uniref:hypothetical protein n=1 Tax=Mucilaginibacter sp. SMC90 TaxID=2929803 RepID=UPI001FB1F3DA|nr:hypothetical protein [Mucilaginibacter sp. SMC90]UOE49012.1 hypothetical protein MTO98_31940 [Mucilaginibacter sp. SMC90]
MPATANIRMYNQNNLGDCFLIRFTSGEEEAYLLIDFGSYEGTNAKREKEIAEDIMKTIGNKKLTIVLTHQHKDHLSGFLTAGDILKGKNKPERELWLSYLDSETSKEGNIIRSATEKYWKKNAKTEPLLKKNFGHVPKVKNMINQKKGFDLFSEGQTGGAAITKLLEIAGKKPRFLTPGDAFLMPGISKGVKVYVLGPPFDNKQLTKMNPGKDEAVIGLNAMAELANMDLSGSLMLDALNSLDTQTPFEESDFPFNRRFFDTDPANPIKAAYEDPDNDWRKIEHDWLSEIGRLSLYMDKLTNNTSLVLAFELVESKRVLLFVGDAQIGNWQSWFNIKFKKTAVTGEDLLKRTVLYKAGHHSSHNATLKQGLELMNEKELVIMIPVNEKVSTKFGFAMLKPEMLRGYHRKSKGRVLRADTIEQDGSKFQLDFPFATRADLKDRLTIHQPNNTDPYLWMELTVKDED